MFRALVPAARRTVTLATVLPLLIFLLVYAAAIVVCEWQGWVRFTWRPAFLLMLATPWLWWLHVTGWSGLSGWRAQLALQVRLLLAGTFVAALAEPRAVRRSDVMSL